MNILYKIRQYLIITLNGMAYGLFGSLLIGLILKQIGTLLHSDVLINFGQIAQYMMGASIGVGVAYSLEAPVFGYSAALISGSIGAGSITIINGDVSLSIGEPMGAFISSLIAVEVAKRIYQKTKFDIILVPASAIVAGGMVGLTISPLISIFMKNIGEIINNATGMHPLPMGIVVAVLMGMILTLPISSAAIAISLGISGLAGGASLVGCSSQMIGFAVSSYRENKMSGLVAQGVGTSMLQISNIIKNPLIWIPPTLTSAILGPLSTIVFKMQSNSIGAGMGTSGFVGQFGTIAAMGSGLSVWIKIACIHFILPAMLSFVFSEIMRKKGWIKFGDMQI